jgi:energy-coupling factor transporter ATP-binding protein EcfA2
MAELHHLKRLFLFRYRQFAHCGIDLTDSETGTILPDLCLIGPNGSGKTTLLAELYQSLDPAAAPLATSVHGPAEALVLAKYSTDSDDLYLARHASGVPGEIIVFDAAIEQSEQWESLTKSPPTFDEFRSRFSDHLIDGPVPTSAPGKSSAWFSPGRSLIDGEEAGDFTDFLERHLEERESQFHLYLKRPENREKTVAQVEQEFESGAPYVLTALKEIWGSLMAPVGLRFDFAQQPHPVLLPDGSSLPFTALSPPIQTLLLRLGQVYSQYFGSDLRPGSLFLDTPEEGLSPELRQGLIDLYRTFLLTQKAPIFVATHCPLIAAQFPPARRLRLKCMPDGTITLARGVAAAGSDLNRILKSDFESEAHVTSTRNTEAKSNRYTRLKRAIQESENQDELADLIDEVMTMQKS